MKFTKEMLTQDEVKRRLTYDPDTGVFTRKASRWGNAKAGRVAGCIASDGYVYVKLGSVSIGAHRLAWLYVYGVIPTGLVDHRNGNTSDNRIDNLRLADSYENAWNVGRSCRNKSGYRGVSWHKAAKAWQAQVTFRGIHQHLGYFDSPEEAAAEYEKVALRLRGDKHRRQKIDYHPKPARHKVHNLRNAVQPYVGYPSKAEYRKALAKAIADGI